MHRLIIAHLFYLLALLLVATGCDTSLPAENPYDPDVPEHQKQPATLAGQVALEQGEPATATIELRPAGKVATPDAEGRFEIRTVTPGTYTVIVTAPGHNAFTQGGVYCGAGHRVDLGQIALLAARGAIQGTAKLELKPETEADSHGGVLVFASPLAAGRLAAGESAQGTVTGPDGGWTMAGLPVGTYQLSGSKEGYAPSSPLEVTVTADETTPVPEMVLRSITGVIRIDDGAAYTNNASGQVTVTVLAFETDEMQISEDPEFGGASWEQHTAERAWTLSEIDGEKTVFMRFRNGDIYETPAVYDTIVLDRAPPIDATVEIAGGKAFVTDPQVALRLQAEDALSGVASMRTALEGEDILTKPWVDYTTQLLVELPVGDDPDGVSSAVQAQFLDGAGNASDVVQDTVVVDGVAPRNAALSIAHGATITASRDVTLTLTADGAPLEMQLSNDSGLADAAWQPYAATLSWRLTENDEQKTVYARLRDGAMNESEIVQDGIELNTRGGISGAFLLEGAAANGHGGITVSLSGTPARTETTGADGSFAFTALPVGVYSLTATMTGFESAGVPYVVVEPGEVTTVESSTLPMARGDLLGTAEREGEADRSGILVEVLGTPFSAMASIDGEWMIRGLPVDQYTVRASASGFLPAQQTDVSVTAGQSVTVPHLLLSGNPGSIRGAVELEGEASDAYDGVLLVLGGSGLTTTSASNGSFELAAVPAGTYPLIASKDGFASAQTVVSVKAGASTDAELLSLGIARGTIEGTATLVAMNDHSGITVEVDGTGYAGVTGGDGDFRIDGVPVGTYSLTARKEEYLSRTTSSPVQVEQGKIVTVDLGELGRQQGDFTIEERASGDREYLNNIEVLLDFSQLPPNPDQIWVAEDEGFSSGAWENFEQAGTTHDYDLLSADGTVTVYVKFKDSADQVSPVFNASAVLDREAPLPSSTVEINGDAAFSDDMDVSLALVGQDATSGVSQMCLSITGACDPTADQPFQASFSPFRLVDPPPGADGEKTVSVWFVDRAGNRSAAPATDAIYLDRAPPQGPAVTINADAAFATDPLVTLTLSADDACTPEYPGGGCLGGAIEPAQMMVSNTLGFTGAQWEQYAATRAWFLEPGDGAKTVYAKFRDGAGNASGADSDDIALDRTPPGGTVAVEGGAYTQGVAINLLLTGPGDVAGVCVYGDVTGPCDPDSDPAGWPAFATPLAAQLTAGDGAKTVRARLSDTAGNRSGEMSAGVILDTQDPGGSATIIEGPYVTAAAATLAIVASPDVARICLHGDVIGACDPASDPSGWAVFSANPAVSLTAAEGAKSVRVVVADLAGRKSAEFTAQTFHDAAPPTGTTLAITGTSFFDRMGGAPVDVPMDDDAATITTAVSLTVAADDGTGSGVAEMLLSSDPMFSGAVWRPFEAAVDLWALPGGAADYEDRTVYAKFRDFAGRESAASIQASIKLDNVAPTAPSVTIEGGSAYLDTTSAQLTLGATGADFRQVSTDPGFAALGWAFFTSPETVNNFDLTGAGTRTVYARFRDEVGNLSPVASASTVIDLGDPSNAEPLVGDGSGYVTSADGITSLVIHCADADSGVASESYRINGGGWQIPALAESYVIDLGAVEGNFLVETRCEDRAGRQSSVEGVNVLWDKTPPTVSGTIQGPDFTSDPVLEVQVTGADGTGSGLFAVAIRDAAFGCASALYQEITSGDTLLLPVSGDGSKTAHLCAMDVAGNRTAASTPSSNSVTLDTTAPATGTLTLAGGDELVNSTTASLAVGDGDNTLLVTLSGDLVPGGGTYWYGPDQDGGGGYSTLPASVTLADANGLNVVSALFTDRAGNTSNSFSALLTVDTTDPADGSVTLAGGQDPVESQTIAVTIEDTAPDTMRFWEMDPIAACGDPACDTGGFVPFVPATSHTFLTSNPGPKRVCWKFCDAAGNDSNVGSQDITLSTVDERPTPVLDSIDPLSYTALSREYEPAPPDPLYPLTLYGRGIAADTKAEVGDFLLDCVPQGSPDGTSCKADSGGGCAPSGGGDCETFCATSCVVSLPPEIMKYSGTYVVRLVTSAPVEGSGVSSNTEFFTVVAPRPEVSRIWPRGIEQLFDAGSEPIAEDVTVEVEGRNWMNNVLFRLGGNYGTLQSLTTDATSGKQIARVTVSTVGLYDSANAPEFLPTIVPLAAVNSGTGGGEDSGDFGLNPRVKSWTDVTHSGQIRPVLRPTEISTYPNANVRRVGLPRISHTMAAAWTGENNWSGSRDEAGALVTRISRTHAPAVTPLPLGAQWCDLEDALGDGSSGGLRDGESTGPLYWHGDTTFAPYTQHDTVGNKQHIAVADLDGSGTPDLVKIDRDNDRVGVSYGAGDGTFGPPTYYGTADEPGLIEVGDVDGDGLPDLLVGCDQKFTLRLNTGTGFGNPVDVDMGWYSGSPYLADLNNDGKVDVVSNKRIRLGNGDGTFQPTQEGPADFRGLQAIADLNGDHLIDVVCGYSNQINVFLGRGDGTFQPRLQFLNTNNVGKTRAADANGDGVLDLYTCDSFEDAVSIRLGNGDGTFGAQDPYPMGDQPFELIVAELNGDGVPDVITGDTGAADRGVSIRLGNPDGTLGPRADIDVPFNARPMVFADINLDGVGDLLIDDMDTVFIKLGNPGQPVHAALAKGGQGPYKVAVADLDRDGNPDVTAAEWPTGGFCWYMGNGDGSLDDGVCTSTSENHVAISDLDGDGIADVVIGGHDDAFVNVYMGTGGDPTLVSFFDAAVPYEMIGDINGVAVGDLNGDGIPDIATANRDNLDFISVRLGIGDGTFAGRNDYDMGEIGQFVKLADLNNDGVLDLMSRDRTALGNGDGSFQPGTGDFSTPMVPLATADLDGDGFLDAISTFYSHAGNGDGTFRDRIELNANGGMADAVLADLDGNGTYEMLVANSDDNRYVVAQGNGDRTFGTRNYLPGGTEPYGVTAADMDGDGSPDLVGCSRNSDEIELRLLGIPGSWAQTLGSPPLFTRAATSHDVTDARAHQGTQLVEQVSVTVLLEWAAQPSADTVDFSLTAPDKQNVVLASEGAFSTWEDAYGVTRYRLRKVYSEDTVPGVLTPLLGVQPAGDWVLHVDNGTDLDAEIKEFLVHTRGQLSAPPLGSSENRPEPIPLPSGTSGRVIRGTLLGFPDTVDVACAQAADGGRDHYYEIDLDDPNTLTVAVDATFDALVEVAVGACDSRTFRACNDNAWHGEKPRVDTAPVNAGKNCIIVSGDQRDGNQHHGDYDMFLYLGTGIP